MSSCSNHGTVACSSVAYLINICSPAYVKQVCLVNFLIIDMSIAWFLFVFLCVLDVNNDAYYNTSLLFCRSLDLSEFAVC